MGPTLTQSQPLFSPKRNPVYPIFDILVCQSKCQIPPVGYHYFEFFGGGQVFIFYLKLYKSINQSNA